MCADHAAVRRPRKGQEQCCCRRRASLSLLPHSEPLAALQRALWLPLCGPIALPRGREGNLKVVHTLAKSRRRAQASALSAATVLISALDCAPWFRRLGSLAHIFRARSRTGDVAKQSYVLIHTGETKLKRKKQNKNRRLASSQAEPLRVEVPASVVGWQCVGDLIDGLLELEASALSDASSGSVIQYRD